MKFKIGIFGGALALGLMAAAPIASAQSIQIGPGGVRVLPPHVERDYRDHRDYRDYRDHRRPQWRGVSEREAARIAQRQGMREIRRVSERGRDWQVSGHDRRGNWMRVTIDRRTGDVLRVARNR